MSKTAEELLTDARRRRQLSSPTKIVDETIPPLPPDAGDWDPSTTFTKKDGGGGGIVSNLITSPIRFTAGMIAQTPVFVGKAIQTGGGMLEGAVDLASEGVQAITGKDPYTSRLETDLARGRAQGLSGTDLIWYAGHRQFPLAAEMGRSIQGTLGRSGELLTAGKFDYGQPGIDYATAWREGNLGALALEDLGNVVLVGRGAGAGNLIERGGAAIGEAGAPRLGRVVTTSGRFVEEPIGTSVRGVARVGQVGAESIGAVGAGTRLGRIAQAGVTDGVGPLRQAVTEAVDLKRARGAADVQRLVAELADADARLYEPNADAAAIKVETDDLKNQLRRALGRAGVVTDARKKIYTDQLYEEARRTNIVTEASRLKTLGPSAVFPDAEAGPMPDYAGPVANLIRTGRIELIMREVANGRSVAEIAAAMTPTQVGPDLERIGYSFTPADIQKAIDYAQGTIDKFGRQSVDAVMQFYTRIGDEFTRGQLTGEYRLMGPMPETYVGRMPVVEFLFYEFDRNGLPRLEVRRLLAEMDNIAVQFLDTLPPELRKEFAKYTAKNPFGAFRALAEVGADHPLAGVAQQMFELAYSQLLQTYPNVMRSANIYPAQLRPQVMADNRLLALARSEDIATIVAGLNQLADQYGDLLGKKTVESIRGDLDRLVGTPSAYLPGSYRNIIRKTDSLLARVQERIADLQARGDTLTAENRALITQLIEAEQALSATQQTIRALVDNLNRISDEDLAGVPEARANLRLSEQQRQTVQEAIAEYERTTRESEMALTPDERQVIVDEIDRAVGIAENIEITDSLAQLVDEYNFRRREVESGKADPATVEEKKYTNRSKAVKERRDQMLADAQRRAASAVADFDLLGIERMAYKAFHEGMKGGNPPYKETLRNLLFEFYDSFVVEEAMRLFEERYVYPQDLGGQKYLSSEPGYKGEDIAEAGLEADAGVKAGARDRELARRLGEIVDADFELTRVKKLRLYEIADEMNRTELSDVLYSGYDLPTLARTIAYATNPNLLTADLRLRDRFVTEMETGVPYEGATPRLIPIPKELLENLRRADRDVTKQEQTVARLRREGTAEQRRVVRARLKGVGKIVEQPDGTVEGQMLKGPQTKADAEIEQLRNKDLYQQNKLAEIRQQYETDVALAQGITGVRAGATAVEQYMAQPFGPQLLGPESQVGYLPAGLPTTARGATRVMTELRSEGAAPQVKSPVEQMRTSDLMPLRLDDMIKRFDEIFNVVGRNKILEDVVTDPRFSITMSRLVDAETLKSITEEAQQRVEQQGLIRTPGQIENEVRKQVGIRLAEIARRAGYEPISPVKVDPETGAHEALGDLMVTVRDDAVDTNTILMRLGLREKLTQQFVARDTTAMPEAIRKVNDSIGKVTSGWKSTVLPFSARWQVGDLVSNVLNAWARGEVPPAELIQRMIAVDALLTSSAKRLDALRGSVPNTLISTLLGAQLQARGVRDFDIQQMRGLNPQAAIADYQLRGPIPGLQDTPGFRMFPGFREKSFRFNEYQNTVARVATAMYKLEQTLTAKGRTLDEVTPYNYIDDAEIRDAVNRAVRETNDALGAFTELSPFEKNVARNIYPFWSWLRYINKAAAKMAIDSPDRVLFAAALGSIATSPEQEGLFQFLEGTVPALGFFFDLSFLNPYQDAVLFQPNPIRAIGEQGGQISPAIAFPAKVANALLYYGGGNQIPFPGAQLQRPGYLEGRPSATTRTLGDLIGEVGYAGLTTFGGPLRNVLTYGPTGSRIPGTDVALGNVQRFPQGSARTTGPYSVQRLGPVASRLGGLLATFGLPRPIIEQDVAYEQATLQSIKDIEAQQRRERERILSRINP
jgi:hypothetical protein